MKFNKKYILEGEITGLFRSEISKSCESTPYSELDFSTEGIIGDKHFGATHLSGARQASIYPKGTRIRNNRQWSAISEEELEKIGDKMGIGTIQPQWLGTNLLIKGIPNFSKLPPLSTIIVRPGEADCVVLVNYYENDPCAIIHRKIIEITGVEPAVGFIAAAYGSRGLVGWIEKGGIVRMGDKVNVLLPA